MVIQEMGGNINTVVLAGGTWEAGSTTGSWSGKQVEREGQQPVLVPIELYSLTQRMGYLSPDLAVGWQIGKYVQEFFDGLQNVRIAAAAEGDAVSALSYLSRKHGCNGRITVPDTPRPWDFLFYHIITGTALNFTLIRKYIELPQGLRSLEPQLALDKPAVVEMYRTGLDLLVDSILKRPVDSFSMIRRIRCRPLQRAPEDNGIIRCRRCGKPASVHNVWDIDGRICCQACSGLEPTWFTYHKQESKMNVSVNKKKKSSHAESALPLKTAQDRISDREMSMCMFGSGGTCCRICNMGPCQIIDGVHELMGVCGPIGQQETLLSTGAVEVMVACGSCVMPSLAGIARAFHTRIITSGGSSRMVEAEDYALTGPEARDHARIILKMAIENFGKRNDDSIPSPPAREEELLSADVMRVVKEGKIAGQLKKGAIRGIGMVIGCNNYRHSEAAHLQVAQVLLKNDILVLTSGCAAESLARAGLLRQETTEKVVGPGLLAACRELGLSPVLPLGTCLDSSRFLIFAAALVNEGDLGRDLADLPLAAVAPLWTSEKIVATGQCLVASGITTFFRELPITGSRPMREYLLDQCRDEYGANWVLEEDPFRLAQGVISHIDKKRSTLDLQTCEGEKS